MYFNYHAKAKSLIASGHCLGYEFLNSYHKISPCLLLYFDNHAPMPIRKHKFEEYKFFLASFGVKEFRS